MKDRWLFVLLLSALSLSGLAAFSCHSTQQGGAASTGTHQITSGQFILEYAVVASQRIDRTRFRYEFDAKVENSGAPTRGTTFEIASVDPSTVVVDSTLDVGQLARGETKSAVDSFAIEQDRTHSFDPTSLVFSYTPWEVATDSGSGVSVAYPTAANTSSIVGGAEGGDGVLVAVGSSSIRILPRGGWLGYGIDPDASVSTSSMSLSFGSATRTDFVDGVGNISLSTIIPSPSLANLPDLRIEVLPGPSAADAAVSGEIIESLQLN